MNNKQKLAALAILPIIGAGALGAQFALAQTDTSTVSTTVTTKVPVDMAEHTAQMFQSQADLLGATLDEVKQAWAEGKSLQELATAKGISAADLQTKMHAQHIAREKTELATLVSQGVITQAQADTRLASIQNGKVKGGFGHGHGGPRGGFGF